MAEEVAIDLNIKTGDAEKNTQSLKSKLKQLKQELAGLEEGSAAFNKVAAEAGKVQDKIGDLNKRVNNLASDTRKLDVVVGVAQGIAGGFAAATGAAALFGVESEDLNKTLLKVQSSLALLNGVQQIANTLNKDGAVMTALNSAAQAAYTFVVGTSTGALKLFRIALASTGIGLIIIAIGVLIAKWDDLTEAIMGSTDAMDKQAEATKNATKEMQAQSKALEEKIKQDRALELANLQSIKEIREQQGLDTLAIDEKIREARLRGGATEAELKIEQIKAETADAIEAYKDRAAKEAEQEKARLQAIEGAKKEFENKKKDQSEIEAEIAKMRIEQAIADKKAEEDAKQTIVDQAAQHAKEANDAFMAQQEIDTQKRIDNEKKVAQAKQDAFAIAAQGMNALSALNNLITQNENQNRSKNAKERLALEKKQFERGKALGIVNTVINTAQAIMAQMANPTPYVGIALAALAGVTGALQVAAIASQKFEGGSGTISQVGSVGSVDTPSVANAAPQVPQTPSSIPIPQQVYVTETDITGTQQQVNVIEGLSKIH